MGGKRRIYNNEEWGTRDAFRRKNKKGHSSDAIDMGDRKKEIWERLWKEGLVIR